MAQKPGKPEKRGSENGLADVKQRIEQLGVDAVGGKGRAFGQDADGIMAVQAFLMAGDHPEIPDTRLIVQFLAKQPGGVLDEDRIRGVQFRKRLVVSRNRHNPDA